MQKEETKVPEATAREKDTKPAPPTHAPEPKADVPEAPSREVPAPAWSEWIKKPATIKVRQAVPGEIIGGKTAKANHMVVRQEDGTTTLATVRQIEAEYFPPAPESEIKAVWKVDIHNEAAVPHEFRNHLGIPLRAKIEAAFETAYQERIKTEEWNKEHPRDTKKVPGYPAVPGVIVSRKN